MKLSKSSCRSALIFLLTALLLSMCSPVSRFCSRWLEGVVLAWKTRVTRQRCPSWPKVKSTFIWDAPSAISALCPRSVQVQLPYRARVIASRMVDLPAPVSPRMAMRVLPVKSSGPTVPG